MLAIRAPPICVYEVDIVCAQAGDGRRQRICCRRAMEAEYNEAPWLWRGALRQVKGSASAAERYMAVVARRERRLRRAGKKMLARSAVSARGEAGSRHGSGRAV